MNELIWQFAEFLLGMAIGFMILNIVLTCLAIRELKAEVEEHLQSRTIPVLVEFDNNQYYCYNKKNQEFLAQGATYDEIKNHLQSRFRDCVIYIDDGDPAVIDQLMRQR
jgi:hypothetical protein